MGNSTTKEQRPSPQFSRHLSGDRSSPSQGASPTSPSFPHSSSDRSHQIYSSRHGRSSRSELSSLLGISHHNNNERDVSSLETRRETKAEREARRLERERISRERERERSMREESVDGGYLVTQGVYTGIEDYSKPIVRQLMIERRLAPFWRGLNDHSSSWTEYQLVAVAKGLPLPAADEIPEEDAPQDQTSIELEKNSSDQNLQNLTISISSRAPSNNSDSSASLSLTQQNFSLPGPASGSALARGRAKTLASLSTSPRNGQQAGIHQMEASLPKDSQVNGQSLGAYLYKDASECPICFLYYPPWLNKTRCCNQAICSECFVQIKRPDPHSPDHAESSSQQPTADDHGPDLEATLVSEPAACPFCIQPEFGVTYDAPPFRKGLVYFNQPPPQNFSRGTALSSSSSSLASVPGSTQLSLPANRRRATSLPATAPTVITTDRVRPDWAAKLAGARAYAARRSAAATALHTAAYLMGNRNGSPDARSFGGFGRRGMLRRGGDGDGASNGNSSSNLSMLALMSERQAANGSGGSHGGPGQSGAPGEAAPSIVGPPRQSSRRNRIDDLEEMMMMEAIRLSLASEEDRRKREEKESKKEAKKKAKEDKKAEKAAHKSGMYSPSANQSSGALSSPQSPNISMGNGKGKTVTRDDTPSPEPETQLSRSAPHYDSIGESAQSHLERSRAQVLSTDNGQSLSPTAPHRPSHLRNLSNLSSSSSSLIDRGPNSGGSHSSFEPSPNASGTQLPRLEGQDPMTAPTPPGEGAGLEPMFNFRSLAAMIDSDEKRSHSPVVEHSEFATNEVTNAKEGASSLTLTEAPSNQKKEHHTIASADRTVPALGTGDVIHEASPEEEADRIEPVPEPVDNSGDQHHAGESKQHEVRILEDTGPRMETGSV